MGTWVTHPERPKGVKDEVKDAKRAKSRPEGPPTRSWGPGPPKFLVRDIFSQNVSQGTLQAAEIFDHR